MPQTIVLELSQPDMFLVTALSDLKIVHPDLQTSRPARSG